MNFVSESNLSDSIPSFSVLRIGKLQMITIDLIFDFEESSSQLIDILLAFREPGNLDRAGKVGMNANGLKLIDEGGHFGLRDFFDGHENGVLFFEIRFKVFKMGFDVSHVNFVPGKDAG
jgi:hypothetical protein